MNIEKIASICEKVGNKLGKGYTENIYQEAICAELRELNILYSKEQVIPIKYGKIIIGNVKADIVLPKEKIVIECKAIECELREPHLPQLLQYMKNLNIKNGIYVNFIQNPSKNNVELYVVNNCVDTYNFEKNKNQFKK